MSWLNDNKDDLLKQSISGVVVAAVLAILAALGGWLTKQNPWTVTLYVFAGVGVLAVVVTPFGVFVWRRTKRRPAPPAAPPIPAAPEPAPTFAATEEPALSKQERELLCAMYHGGGSAHARDYFGQNSGKVISAGKTEFRREGDRHYETLYELAMDSLIRRGLVRDLHEPNFIHPGTPKGYSFALTKEGKRRAVNVCPPKPAGPVDELEAMLAEGETREEAMERLSELRREEMRDDDGP